MQIHTTSAILGGILFWCSLVSAQPNGSVTQGAGAATVADLMPDCQSNHVTPLGTITSTDGINWVVPAETNFQTRRDVLFIHSG